MKIAIMMRAMDQDSGFRYVVDGCVDGMLNVDFSIRYRSEKYFGRFAFYSNVMERLGRALNKLIWDRLCVPWRAWKERADLIFNPKFSVPLFRHCPSAMGLQEPAGGLGPSTKNLSTRFI
jgi:hypothetical protein